MMELLVKVDIDSSRLLNIMFSCLPIIIDKDMIWLHVFTLLKVDIDMILLDNAHTSKG